MAIDVAGWLRGLGLQQYEPAFRDNEVDGAVLADLTAEDLIGLGVTLIGHRRKLLSAIAALAAEAPAAPLLAAAVPAPVPTPVPSQPEAERRQLTVMFCDIVGSTALSTQFDPEDLRELINAYHKAVANTVSRFDGFVAKYMGDGVLIYFGYPQAHEDDAERSVHAGLAVIEAVAKLSGRATLLVRIGIATGLAVVGDLIGAGASQERGVVGETPNLAARMQGLAEPNTIVIADGTRRQIGGLFDLADLGPQLLAGFAEAQNGWRVLGESGVLSRFEALRPGTNPLVGRAEDLDVLVRRWEQVKTAEGRVVLLSGEPGIGKSHLTASFNNHIEREPHTRLRYFCSPHRQDSVLHPVVAQLEHAAGFARDDTPEQKRVKLVNTMAASAGGADDIALLGELLSIPNAASDLNLNAQRRRERTFEALLSQLDALASRGPVLLVFEDAHWADPTSRELLDLMVDHVRNLPVLLLVTSRPEFQHNWSGRPQVTVMTLDRLGGRDGAALVERLAGVGALSNEMIAEIAERTDGVPLFIEELTKAVLESAEAGDRVAQVLSATPLTGLSVPAALHATLMARLDWLGPAAKEIAQIGAVLGREFSYDFIRPVARRPEAELRIALDRLSGSGLLFCRGVVPNASYLFKHALVQDAAYGTLLRGRRQELHGRVAAVLDEHFPELVHRRPELLAHHLTGAAETERAVAQWLKAGQSAAAHSAHLEAGNHIKCALDLLGTQPSSERRDEQELELTLALAVPLIAANGFGSERVEECAIRAKELSDKLHGSKNRFAAQRVAWNSCLMRQPVPKTVALARDLVGLADPNRDSARFAIALRALGYSLLVAGELREAIEILAQGAALADGIPDEEFAIYGEHPSMVCRLYSGQAHMLMGFAETGTRLLEKAVAHGRRGDNPHSLAWALGVAAHVFQLNHEPATTDRLASETMEVAREHRLPQWLALGERCKGWAMHRLGDREAGLNLQRDGVKRWYETGAKLHTTHCEIGLADSYLYSGEVVAAGKCLTAAHAHRLNYGENYLDSEIQRLEAVLLLREVPPSNSSENTCPKHQASRISRERGASNYVAR